MDKILQTPEFVGCNWNLLKKITTEFLENYRENLQKSKDDDKAVLEFSSIVVLIKKEYDSVFQNSLIPLINATGVVVHTNLGRSVFSSEILREITPLLTSYNNLEYDEVNGIRGERYHHLKKIFKALIPCEDVLVVNNNAAAVFLIFNTFAKNREVIVSRGELVEIGGSFRIPCVMADSGAILKEVGTTNRTHLRDYSEAVCENTAMLFKAHKSNYEILGFSAEVDLKELIALANEKGILDYYDLGSGFLEGQNNVLQKYEMSLEKVASLNPSLVSFSGDKLLGGAQAGVIFGKKKYIDALKKNQLLRMLRVDKLTISVLEATLKAYLKKEFEKIPTYYFLNQNENELQEKAQKLFALIPQEFHPKILKTQSFSGGGALPNQAFDSFGVALGFENIKYLEKLLRESGIIARIENEKVILDVRCLFLKDFAKVGEILENIKEKLF